MNRRITLRAFIFVPLLFVNFGAYSQTKADDFHLSVAVEQNAFTLPEGAKVRVKIENSPWRTAAKDIPLSLEVTLRRHGSYGDCRRGDCFVATYRLEKLNEVKDGESFEADIDLMDLYWNDATSSATDLSEPKNMAKVITRGGYNLSVSLYFPAPESTKQEPRVVAVTSNKVVVEVR